MKCNVLFPDLNDKIKREFHKSGLVLDVRDNAPDTFPAIVNASSGKLIKVYSGGSESTIYADPSVNYMFRALHDHTHIKLGAGFDLTGETRVALEQCRLFGGNYAPIILAEVVEQAREFFSKGEFPANQVEFVTRMLKDAA